MDWKDIGAQLIRLGAPVIGTAIAGPIGGTAGGILGNILANSLGVEPTPQAIDSAMKTMPPDQLQARLAAADNEAAAKWQAIAAIGQADAADRSAQSAAINETIRAELATQRWYSWRNLWGYSCVAEISLTSLLILHELFTGDFKAINAFVQLSGFFLSWYGMRIGVLGYVVKRNSDEKTAAMTGEVPSIVGQVVKAVVKR